MRNLVERFLQLKMEVFAQENFILFWLVRMGRNVGMVE